jgi:HlyD family secretion protein
MTLFRWIFALLVAGLVGMVVMKSLRPHEVPPQSVQTAKAEKTTVTRTVTAAGKLSPVHKVNVSSNITGILVDLKVGIGSEVKKGQYLGQIDTSRYDAQLDQQNSQASAASADARRALANQARVHADAERLQRLVDKGAGNASDLAQARDQERMAEAEVAAAQSRSGMARAAVTEAKKTLGWATLNSPIDGTVLDTMHRVGERIRGSDFAEDVVLVIGSLDQMEVAIEVGEHDVVYVKPGQKATIEIDALPICRSRAGDRQRPQRHRQERRHRQRGHDLPGLGDAGAPAAARAGGHERAGVDHHREPSRRGGGADPGGDGPRRGRPAGHRGAAAGAPKPQNGVMPRPSSRRWFFVVKDGAVQRRKVQTGLSSDSNIEVLDGVAPGEEVVEGPYRVLARQLEDGPRSRWRSRARWPAAVASTHERGCPPRARRRHAPLRHGRGANLRVARRQLHAAQGEYVGIVGSSGSGKSTLLNILGSSTRRPRAPTGCAVATCAACRTTTCRTCATARSASSSRPFQLLAAHHGARERRAAAGLSRLARRQAARHGQARLSSASDWRAA